MTSIYIIKVYSDGDSPGYMDDEYYTSREQAEAEVARRDEKHRVDGQAEWDREYEAKVAKYAENQEMKAILAAAGKTPPGFLDLLDEPKRVIFTPTYWTPSYEVEEFTPAKA